MVPVGGRVDGTRSVMRDRAGQAATLRIRGHIAVAVALRGRVSGVVQFRPILGNTDERVPTAAVGGL